MNKCLDSFPLSGKSGAGTGSALIIVLCFVVLLTVVVLAALSHSLFSGMISNASSNVSRSDLYGHGAINQIIGDLRQEIAGGSTVTTITTGTISTILYRPNSAATNSVPYNSGPYAYGSSPWTSLPNLVKESCHGVAFYPNSASYGYDGNGPSRAAPVSTTSQTIDGSARIASGSADGTSRNGRYVSVTRWNKPLLLPKASATFSGGTPGAALTISTDTSTSATPVSTFIAPDWILTAADGSNPTSWPSSPNTTIENPKSNSYVMGRYAYVIYNEGGLLDANVAGCPAPLTGSFSGSQKTILSRKGPSAFADLTQLPGIASLTVTSANRPQKVVDTLVGWRNNASSQAGLGPSGNSFPSYSFSGGSIVGNYLTYLLGISNNFMSTGNGYATTGSYYYNDPNSGQNVTDQYFVGRQQMISFFQNIAKNATEQAFLQDAMMYLGTFSRSLNQPSYWPDPGRPAVVGQNYNYPDVQSGVGNSAWTDGASFSNDGGSLAGVANPANVPPYAGIYNPPLRGIRVASPGGWLRNDGTTAVTGEPLIKKRFALNRLIWLTYKGESASLSTSDALYSQYQAVGVPVSLLSQMWSEGTPGKTGNIYKYFGLQWTAGPGPGGLGGYWTYNHGITSGGATIIGTLDLVAAANREPDFFELLKSAICTGSLAKLGGSEESVNDNTTDTRVDFQILQIGANIIDAFSPDSYPTNIVFNDGTSGYSFWGQKNLPYLLALEGLAVEVRAPSPAPSSNGASFSGTYTDPGQGALLQVPTIWNPYNSAPSGGVAIPSSLAPQQLRIAITQTPEGGSASSNLINITGTVTTGTYSIIAPWSLGSSISSTTGTFSYPNGSPPPSPNPAPANNTVLYFNNVSTLYRDPTPLLRPGYPLNSGLTIDSNNLIAEATGTGGIPEAGTSNRYIGFLETANYPIYFTSSSSTGTVYPLNFWGLGLTALAPNVPNTLSVTLEYDATGTGVWVPYMQYNDIKHNGNTTSLWLPPFQLSNPTVPAWNYFGTSGPKIQFSDPRGQRWGDPFDCFNSVGALTGTQNGWIDGSAQTLLPTPRATAGVGGTNHGFDGQNSPATAPNGWMETSGWDEYNMGAVCQNIYATSGSFQYYGDADGVVRRGIFGAQSNPCLTTTLPNVNGQPMADITGAPSTTATTVANSRPILLNRPFRSVAELGSVFSGTPWKNLDFFQPESGNSALLDVFCINEDYRSDAVTAGRVDLNSKQAPVFQALLNNAYRDDANANPISTAPSASEIATIAQALVKRTTAGGTNPNPLVSLTAPQPLSNIADLVGRWIPGTSTANASTTGINGAAAYDGFSADLYGKYASFNSSGDDNNFIQRYRETAMRALSDAGQAGTWNLLIDVVAQSGHYPANASGLSDFLVEGEQRYWVHVAIDRQTDQIIDENIEVVNE